MPGKRVFVLIVLILCCMSFFSGAALAQKSPYNATKDYIDEVMQTFLDYNICDKKEVSPEKKEKFREKLSAMAASIFDFEYMCRKAVGPYWRVFTEKQREQAVSLFTELLETNYFGKMMEHLEDVQNLCRENLQVLGQEMLSENKAKVKSIIIYKDDKFPVNYMMRLNGGEWQIYDVEIEGVSLINNYSSQFRDILGRKKPEGFLEQLKNKVQEKK